MTEICLVRHGQTDWNSQGMIQGREDIPLNQIGRLQAQQSAVFLQQEHWDVMITSPLVRAFETAQIIADAVGIDSIHIDERFIERDFGEVSSQPSDVVRDLITSGNVRGMETEEEIIERCFSALCKLADCYEGKKIIIVGHAHVIKAILHAINPALFTFHTSLQNACISFLSYYDKIWEVKQYNITKHIQVRA